jgi:K+-transporting ATPase ATPase A chain
MTDNGILQILLYLAVLLALVKPLGAYMARVYQGQPCGLDRLLRPVERGVYRLLGKQAQRAMDWKTYTVAMLLFNIVSIIVLYVQQWLQAYLPFNPQQLDAVAPDLALNTAVSFATNTNWQNYGGETTMSYLTQMAGLAVHNFTSAATGLAVLLALIRGLAGRCTTDLGNFWVDITRSVLYILLPLALVLALVLVSQGVVQTVSPYPTVPLIQSFEYDTPKLDAAGQPVKDAQDKPVMEKATQKEQAIAVGPVASQMAIKHLGTNGGGFFNVNAAHPFESPTPLTDFLLVLAQTLLAAALTYTFGKMVGDTRQGWAILAAMLVVLAGAIFTAYAFEAAGNPAFTLLGVDQTASEFNPGGNMEGKEQRFGIARSALFAVSTTATSCGAVDSMHDSFTPLGGLMPMAMMQLGETILGGVGTGLKGMLAFVLLTVFIAGLMVGRTPEYLGKKIEAFEMKMIALVVLLMPFIVLGSTALAMALPAGVAAISNPGVHGFSEVLYAFTSMGNNNGSAFAGLSGNNLFYNLLGALVMFIGRFGFIVPLLVVAGSLAGKQPVPVSGGTLPTHNLLFIALLVGVVLVVGALTFFPALALGPITEHLQLYHTGG